MKVTYSELQLDALRELANIGSGTAATALSTMLSTPIDVSVPVALALPLADAVDAAGDGESMVTAVLLGIHGDIGAIVVLLFPPEDAATLCRLLGVDPDGEVGLSAIGEIGNIVGSAYIGVLAAMTGLAIEPTPPQTVTDLLAAIVGSVLATGAAETDIALLLDSDLLIEGTSASLSFMLVPDSNGISQVLAGLGMAG
jgi:chemotaxis protein CheC